LIGQTAACLVDQLATAAMTIMVYPVIVTPVWRRRSIITHIGCAIVNRGWNVINRWRIDGRSNEGRKPEADPNADSAVCPSRGSGHQNSGEYRSESRPAPGPSNSATKPIHVHPLAFSLP
jgi:hypothetical protein